MHSTIDVVFVTPSFGSGATGPETYAHYLWDEFGEDTQINFHVVAPSFSGDHSHWHAAGPGTGSLDLYQRLARKALEVAEALRRGGHWPILHINNSHLHASLLGYPGKLWGQVNDYENADLWRRAGETIRRTGWRRFLALFRRRWLERRFLLRQDLSLCNSDFTRKKILTEYQPVQSGRIITLHKAVDLKFFQRPTRLPPDPLDRPITARKFIFVGRDIVRKGLDTLLTATQQLPTTGDWHLTIVGATQAEAAAAFNELSGLSNSRMLFAGALDKQRLREVLWRSDVFVLPSRAEALGVALLEALTAGLPVVATDVGGIPEIICDPSAGILIPADRPLELATAMVNIPLWSNGRPEAVQKILDAFSTKVMLRQLRKLYLQQA